MEGRVGIDFYEIDFEVFIKHEVQPVQLEHVGSLCWIYFTPDCSETVSSDLLNLRENVAVEAYIFPRESFVQVCLELRIPYFVT